MGFKNFLIFLGLYCSRNFLKRSPKYSVPVTTYLLLVSFGVGLPATTAIFPQISTVDATQVEEKFGPPLQKLPEVGDPPIIRWIYPTYTVYFEYQHVIDVVVHR